ncbi:MAG: biopolymer transporter ExbD, partial [Burkholderiales bacterium]
MIERRNPRRLMNQINVVPYIDVMLVLLVIFMITAPLFNPGQIELPQIAKSLTPPVAPLEVGIKANKTLMLRDRSINQSEHVVSQDELVKAIKEKQSRNPEQPVVI